MLKKIELVLSLFMVVALICAACHIYGEQSECDEKGGDYVRTLMWYKCVGVSHE